MRASAKVEVSIAIAITSLNECRPRGDTTEERLQLARRADDLPDHVEPNEAREAEAGECDPLESVDSREQGRSEQEGADDDGCADAVCDRVQVGLQFAEPHRNDSHLQRALLELAQDVPELARNTRQRVELGIQIREETVRLEAALRFGDHHVERLA